MSPYVIVTPAHNEAKFIGRTLESMVRQTLTARRWVIVDDGSTDGTADVVADYAARFDFIRLVRKSRDPERNFARKVHAFERGLEELRDVPYEFIGNVDADMSFGEDYFERILGGFDAEPRLGISGGIVYTKFTRRFKTYDRTTDSVGGKVQLFRRRCFEEIGGYRALAFGGIDATAEIMARMRGWTVRKSLDVPAFEHRPTGFAYGNPLQAKVCEGRRFHSLGYDPTFYVLRCIYRAGEFPLLIGSAAALGRFFYGMARGDAIVLPEEVVRYLRHEQRQKLRRLLRLPSRQSGGDRNSAS